MARIADFYAGKSIFLTGASGFVGKAVLEKLLRSCPDIVSIAILLRGKRDLTPSKRLELVLQDPLFDSVRKTHPQTFSKIRIVEGDLLNKSIVSDSSDLQRLLEETHIVIHSAASINLAGSLIESIETNLWATHKLLEMAKRMERLQTFLHVSTAYANCDRKRSEEFIYSLDLNPRDFLDPEKNALCRESLPQDFGFPNTYTFSKRLTELLLSEYSQTIPVVIVRPSIICGSVSGPVPGWVDNFNGPSAFIVAVGNGFLTSINLDLSCKPDLIPVDFVANLTIAACPTASKKNLRVYNGTSRLHSFLTWNFFLEIVTPQLVVLAENHGVNFVPPKFTRRKIIHTFRVFLFAYIPTLLVDLLMCVTGRKRILLKVHKRTMRTAQAMIFFGNNEWEFDNRNARRLLATLSEDDRREFNFDIDSIAWPKYLTKYSEATTELFLKSVKDPKSLRSLLRLRMHAVNFTKIVITLGLAQVLASLLWFLIAWN